MRIIAGPCVHESIDLSQEIAETCQSICNKYNIDYYFKASFDKANRTSLTSYRGEGLDTYLKDMRRIVSKKVTDVHETWHVNKVKDTVDVIQIPAFLCRQTDLITSAVNTGLKVNIKKGQFLAPWDIKGILSKCKNARDSNNIWITERGTSFGYNRLVVDFSGMVYMLRSLGNNLIFDGTHSVQQPGSKDDSTGGDSSFIPSLLRAAAAIGVQSFFLEVHPEPSKSPSDGPNMLDLNKFDETIEQIMEFSYEYNPSTL